MMSPISASSGTRSPWPSMRKHSAPGPRRPPSPELTNLDCAFPPFPMPLKASTAKQLDRSTTRKSETQRPKSRNAPRLLRQDTAPLPLTRARSSNNLAGTAARVQRDAKSGPASPVAKGSDAMSNISIGREENADKVPEVQGAKPPEKKTSRQLPEDGDLVTVTTLSRQLLISNTDSHPQRDAPPLDHALNASVFNDTPNTTTESPENTLTPISLESKPRADAEPAYKSKRPPPLVRDPFPPSSKPKTRTPLPSSASVLSKGFGRLFGRRRSRSLSSRREVVRQALSDEPDVFENQFGGQTLTSARSDGSFHTAEPSLLSTTSVTSPPPLLSHEESLKALEGLTPAPHSAPIVLVEPAVEDEPSRILPASPDTTVTAQEAANSVITVPEVEQVSHEVIESLRRISIDSASSYGSMGFSEHATSSSSSSARTDSLAVKSFDSLTSHSIQPMNADIPAPLRPGRAQTFPDSPVDPLFQQGQLSPIPGLSHGPINDESMPPLPPTANASQISPPRHLQPKSEPNQKGTAATPNKGICRGCSRVILVTQKSVSSADGRLTGRYHKECFVCQTCQSSFPTAEFYVHNDQPYCAHHYHELENSLCATCGKGIEGLYMETTNVAGRGKEKHHPECLKCTTCQIRLDHDYFELSGKVYCESDAFRMTNTPKSRENAPSRPSPLIREYISSGDRGLLRGRNFPERRTTKLMTMT